MSGRSNTRGDRRHLDTQAILDYLEDRADAAGRRRLEEHLARPCTACRERLRELATLAERMRADRTPPVPAWLHARAVNVFQPAPVVPLGESVARFLAELLFDSAHQPALAGARRSVGEARRLRYALGSGDTLELELEREGTHTQQLRGHLQGADAALAVIDVAAGDEHRRTSPDADGAFQLAGLPAGALELTVDTLAGRWRLPVPEQR